MQLSLFSKWFPSGCRREDVERSLRAFYRDRNDYHNMTASGDKAAHPQVRLLECLVRPDGKYAEIGCGGGAVIEVIGREAHVTGFDVSQLALSKARTTCGESSVELVCSGVENLPVRENIFDGVYSFEMLEHVWDPLAAVQEMVRVTKPGGFVLISAPLVFSLDLHLTKKVGVRICEYILAGLHLSLDTACQHAFVNVSPLLDGEVFPDCDLITAIVPSVFSKEIERMGCRIDYWDTTYMCANKEGSHTDLDFQRNASRRFVRHFGDHLLLLAHKT